METVVLYNGTLVDIRFEYEMFRADIDGVHFCAPTRESLENAIARVCSAVRPEEVPEPLRPVSELLFEKLKNGKLEEKQEARRRMFELLKNGDASVIKYLEMLPNTPVSRDARYTTMMIGKKEFEDVSFEDLSQNVPDLVQRSKLMKELESRFTLNASSN